MASGGGGPTFTVDEALVKTKFGKFQGLVLGYAGMGWVAEAMEMMLLSFVGPAVKSEWGLSSRQESMITTAVFVGELIGAYSWGIVSDKHGRRQGKHTHTHFFYLVIFTFFFVHMFILSRRGFLIPAVITFVAGFLSSFAPNYTTLIILRCFVGIGLGGGPVFCSWFLEFIPTPDRGTWMVGFSAFWTVGTIFEASLAWPSVRHFSSNDLCATVHPLRPTLPTSSFSIPVDIYTSIDKQKQSGNDIDKDKVGVPASKRLSLRECESDEVVQCIPKALVRKKDSLTKIGAVDDEFVRTYTVKKVQTDASIASHHLVPRIQSRFSTSNGVEFIFPLDWMIQNKQIGVAKAMELKQLTMPTLGWRWLLALSSLPSLALLLFYGFTPESPRYLCLRGRTTEALAVLEEVARMNRVELPPGLLVSDKSIELNENCTPSEDTHLLSADTERNEAKVTEDVDFKAGSASLLTLLSPKLLRSTLLLWLVFFGNSFSYYGLVLLTSELTSRSSQCTSKSFHLENTQDTVDYRDVFIASFAEFPGLLLSAVTVDRLGRKLSMSTMLFSCCLFLLPLVFEQSESLTTGLLFGARMCIMGAFTIVYIYAPEIYPTSVRSTGVGVGSSIGRIGGMVCPLVAVGLVQGCHRTASILLFEIIIFLSGVAVIYFPFETKGCELSDSVLKKTQSKIVI
ncbi:hypothetical protein IFM89_033826 [Coptis chinensis]|uniref:Major facilitator superfamily (MFS) profile domain-containing protein n=1 Tax=Coptis chinensis TaxID=261450 RepID=A0A835LXJ0_9MAGN|nr:hypothetical protein IFM89_033826 [Coptis chinensis]